MSSTPESTARGLTVVGTAASLRRAEELIDAHAVLRPVRTVALRRGGENWRRALGNADAAILLTDPDMPVAEAVEGTHVRDRKRDVPVGVLPDEPLAIAAAAHVQRRFAHGARPGPGPFVLLSSREDHVRERARHMAAALAVGHAYVRELPTGRIDRAGLLAVLAVGPGLAIYTGEGNARGWQGYGRIETWELGALGPEPIGALISLSCCGSARLGSLRGLCESVVAHGGAASALGAVSEVRTEDNDRLGVLLAQRISAGAVNLAEALPEGLPELAPFRISGDPLAPFIGARDAWTALRRVAAPAAGDRLEAVRWG